jgi:poly-gamma-glutamate synthesis protein (capsule biosynthesis protein)
MKVFACGDIVNVRRNNDFVSPEIRDLIKSADVAIGNFEAPIEGFGEEINKVGPHLCQAKTTPAYLKKAGFNVLSLANNHIYDYGQEGIEKTIEVLSDNNIAFVGGGRNFEEAYRPLIKNINNYKIGIIAAADAEFGCLLDCHNRGGYSWINHPLVEQNIIKTKKEVDVLMLVAHVGAEEVDVPLPEWRKRFRHFCDLGVDIIIGHHPHVPQGYEHYNNSIIFYSLGNFYMNSPGFERSEDTSYSVLINIENKKWQEYEIIPHSKKDDKLLVQSTMEFDNQIRRLNQKLCEDYSSYVNTIVKNLYYDRYLPFYAESMLAMNANEGIYKNFKALVKQILFPNHRKKHRELLLLDIIRNETHRWVVQRALELQYESLEELE